ncbi:hypothetical protein BZG36_04714 [Bifiguratus adelaidae]|uniref:PITH domain-containing protein n=1 Tax=Bifiguratus adelaidae TaxID=1938954 RepID=A0A261XV30_9FUNG|nr:hypothetical protein BZG36_04714 [Bifiguratus adelaidae]
MAGNHDDHAQYHDHGHDHEDLPEAGGQDSLYAKIDRDNVRCLNEAEPESGKKYIESDSDDQLIFHIPFTGNVKLRSICIRSTGGAAAPAHLKVFINRDDVDFDSVESFQSTQEWELVQSSTEVVEYGTRIPKFTNVRHLALYFPSNFDSEDTPTRIDFLGFKGEWTEIKKDPIITVYEASANPADHKKIGVEDRLRHGVE